MSLSFFAKTEAIHPKREHGGIAQFTHAKATDEAVLDFSVNVNPYGPSPLMRRRLATCVYDQYPDPDLRAVREYLSKHLPVSSPEQILVGNGAAELIWNVVGSLTEASDELVCIEPTFSEFRHAAQAHCRVVHEIRASETRQFKIKEERLLELLSKKKPKLVYLCNPNSPTGLYFSRNKLQQWMRQFPESYFLVDQAFLRLHRNYQSDWQNEPLETNEIRLISYTKDHAIPGVRLGALLTSEMLIERLKARLPSWNVNAFAIAAALTVFEPEEMDFIERSHRRIWENHDSLLRSLQTLGRRVHHSDCPFLLLEAGDADQIQQLLWQQRILLRSCRSYGLERWVRIFPRHQKDNERLVTALNVALNK